MTINQEKIIPAIRVNNRSVNQSFFERDLGLKTILEDGPFAEFGAYGDKTPRLVLIESPSMRTRSVEGKKKLERIVLKVENPDEITSLLARGSKWSKLFQGKNGYAFEAQSPEGDLFLLHAEENVADLKEVTVPTAFSQTEGFLGLSKFSVETIVINTPQPAVSQAFYETILPDQTVLTFQEAQGADLLVPADQTWDLDSLRFSVSADMDWVALENQLTGDFFKDKKENFLQTVDPSQIELWFEK